MNSIEVSTVLNVTPEEAWDALIDIEERSKQLPSFRGVEILSRDRHEMVVRMDEHVDGEDVTVTSRFTFERPHWMTYEHLESPFGKNHGRFDITLHPSSAMVAHRHSTEQDLDAKPTLRAEWIETMHQMHASIEELALRRR